MAGYEDFCREYALFGNPVQDHWDHEFNAQFDRFDGHRSLCTAGYDHPHWDDAEGDFVEPAPRPAPEPSEPLDDNVPF